MGDATSIGATCVHCGSPLRENTPFCTACGRPVADRQIPVPTAGGHAAAPQHDVSAPPANIVGVGRGVRCTAYALDLAVMTSPALPLAMTAVVLNVAAVAYVVTPVAFLAGWTWMSIWQGLTGMSFGKAMLGLRAIRPVDDRPPPFLATVLRGVIFAGTAGLAALPVLAGCSTPGRLARPIERDHSYRRQRGRQSPGPASADRATHANRSKPESGSLADSRADPPVVLRDRTPPHLGSSLNATQIHPAPR